MGRAKHAGVVRWALMAASLFATVVVGLPPLASAQSNPIVIENQQAGTSQWQIGLIGTDAVGQI